MNRKKYVYLVSWRSLVLILLVLLPMSKSMAITKLSFTLGGGQAIASLKPTDWDGSADDDGLKLYALMNVVPKDSFLGPGKAVMDKQQFLTITCAIQSKQCSIVLRAGSNSRINPSEKAAIFSVTGEGSRLWRDQFHLSPEGTLEFHTTDEKMFIKITDNEFILRLQENP